MRRPSADPVGPVRRLRRPSAWPTGAVRVRTAPTEAVQEAAEEDLAALSDGWQTVVWNDPVNLMTYVTYVFRSYFGYSEERASRLMRQVHEQGRATVSRGNREQMEIDVQAMHGFGLWATLQAAGE